jgi:hypothetical protein
MAYYVPERSPSEDSRPEIIELRRQGTSRRSRSAGEPRDAKRNRRRRSTAHREPAYEFKGTADFTHEEVPRSTGEKRTRTTSRRTDCDGEDALNELYGGQTMQPVPLEEPSGRYEDHHHLRAERHYPRPPGVRLGSGAAADSYGRHSKYATAVPEPDPDAQYLRRPPRGSKERFWERAAQYDAQGNPRLSVRLIVTRKGRRYQSQAFEFTGGHAMGLEGDDDYYLAERIKRRYARLKSSQIGLMQKIIAYRTIAYVYILQYRCTLVDSRSRWQVTARLPITSKDDDEGRANFMYLLRNKDALEDRYTWADTLENCATAGAVIDLEVVETFDSIKIYWGLLFAILLSLGAALAYGFTMDNDFSTGFSIASWMITAFGFFAAVVAAGEYFGLERPNSFAALGADLEQGAERPRMMGY